MSVKISVLVPVYNVEKSLDRCMESILNQTFKDIEIIMVDDGSTDGSPAICDRYGEKYDNVKVIHKENEGLGPTRDRGVREASGEYIYHCDSDDWLKEDLLEKAYEAITKADADVCIFGYDLFTEENGEMKPYGNVHLADGLYTSHGEITKLFVDNYYNGFIVMSAWNRLYKRSFIVDNELWFPALRRAQDMAYSMLLFDKLTKVVTLEEALYCYIIEPGTFKGRSFDEMLEIYWQINDFASDYFSRWGLLDENQRTLLDNRTCEAIANYSSYALVTKYPEQREGNLQHLVSDEKLVRLFKNYKNVKKSKFMTLFCTAMKLKSKKLVYEVAKMHEKK
jgi:glycosyltransferase involved in cell wall biosynthesis